MHFYRKCWFDLFKEQFISLLNFDQIILCNSNETGFLSDCPSLILGIAIRCIQHSQATLERGVCEFAHSFFHFPCNECLLLSHAMIGCFCPMQWLAAFVPCTEWLLIFVEWPGGDRNTLTPSGNLVTDNLIWRFSRETGVGANALTLRGVAGHVQYNNMHTGQYTAIRWAVRSVVIVPLKGFLIIHEKHFYFYSATFLCHPMLENHFTCRTFCKAATTT